MCMLPPRIHCVGSRPLRHRALAGLLASVVAVAAGVSPATAAPSNEPVSHNQISNKTTIEYNHQSVALFNPLANIAATSDRTGATNAVEMIKKWKDLRVPPQQMMALVEVLILTQSPILSANPETLEDAKSLSRHTYDIFSVETLAQINAFLDQKSIARLEIDGWLAPGATLVNSRNANEFSQVLEVWEQYSQFTDSGAKAPLYNPDDETPQKMAQAVNALKIAIQDTGLNSLTVPLPMWSSSEHLTQIAFHLQQSNRELQSVTQWSGPVLGLKEKVNLTITWGRDLSIASQTAKGEIDIQSSFSSFAHEWEHALEYILAQEIQYKPVKGPALITRAIADNIAHPVVQKWEYVGQTIDTTMANTWYPKLQELSLRSPSNAAYYSNRHEHVAYTFESFVEGRLPATASLRYIPQADRSGRIGPTAEQAAPTAPMWSDVLEYLNQYWWNPNTHMVLETSHFKDKVKSRRPLLSEPNPPTL